MNKINLMVTVNNRELLENYEAEKKKYLEKEIDILRVNCTLEQESFSTYIERIRKFTQKGIMLDIPYPYYKMRVFTPNNISCEIKKGDVIEISSYPEKRNNVLFVCNDFDDEDVVLEDIFWVGDGEGGFEVIDKLAKRVIVRALNNFTLISGKSINTLHPLPTYKNNEKLTALMRLVHKIKPEYVALSFVQNPKEIIDFRKQFSYRGKIFAKIENEDGIINAERIIEFADGIILGRGDMGLCSSVSKMLLYERKLSQICKEFCKEFVVATDILGSLKNRFVPSRADVIDCLIIREMAVDRIIINAGQDVRHTIEVLKELCLI